MIASTTTGSARHRAKRAGRRWSAAMLAVAAVAGGCSTGRSSPVQPEPPASSPAGVESLSTLAVLRVGESAEVGDRVVTFTAVREDSRCPTGVECLWEGDAAVELLVDEGGEPTLIVLHTALEPQSTVAAGLRLTLERLDPQPVVGRQIPPADYEATLRIEAG